MDTWLDRLGLLPLAEANPFTLSQGQKRRLSVASMLIRGQSGLILDEPTLGQDELQATRLMAMMQEFRAEGGTVAMVTHDMRLVSEHADSLLVLSGAGPCTRAARAASSPGRNSWTPRVWRFPPWGGCAQGLHRLAGTCPDLLTVRAFLRAAGRADDAAGGAAGTAGTAAPGSGG